jgi:hypothetical protein
MAAVVRLYQYAVVEVDGHIDEFGSMTIPRMISLAGQRVVKDFTIAVSTEQNIFDLANEVITDFDFMWIASDFDLLCEVVVDDAADVGEVAFTLDLIGTDRVGDMGPAIVFCSDDSYANNTAGFAGTLDQIERIRVKNESSTQAAKVEIGVFT